MSGPAGLKYAPVEDDTADLLAELAEDRITQAVVLTDESTTDPEWDLFVDALHQVALAGRDRISPNAMRPLIHGDGKVPSQRIGPFYTRACREGLIQLLPPAEWDVSDDTNGGNAGKYARTYKATGLIHHRPTTTNTQEHS